MALQTGILSMFARSPMRPLQKHMEKVYSCAQTLLPFFEAALAGDWEKGRAIRQTLSQYEHDADELKMELRLNLPRSLFLPVPRGDILSLLSKQDKIANIAKDISGIMLGRTMQIPDTLRDAFLHYLRRSLDAVSQANTAISELDELLESGFRGKEVELVTNMITQLAEIETDTDQLQIALREQLFRIESNLKPVDVMFLYKIIQWIGDLADVAQQAGSRLRMLSAD